MAGVTALLRSGNTVRTNVEVVNLSLGGAFVRTFELFPMGAKVLLALECRGLKRAIPVSGEVVTVRNRYESGAQRLGPGMGVRFAPLAEEARRQLESLLSKLAPAEGALEGDLSDDGPDFMVEWFEPTSVSPSAVVPAGELELLPPSDTSGAAEEFQLLERGASAGGPPDSAVVIGTIVDESGDLALEVARLRRELEARDARQRSLEAENQKLLEDLSSVKSALTQVTKV